MSHAIGSLFATILVLGISSHLLSQPLAPQKKVTFSGEVLKHSNLSAVAVADGMMFAADDELRGVLVGKAGASGEFAFGPVVPLPLPPGAKDDEEEFDIEGLAVSGSGIFAIGSHSAVRTSSDSGERTQAANRKRQQQVSSRRDREWVFRFQPEFDPSKPEFAKPVQAANLSQVLLADPLLKPFVGLPGKENGVDIEGLAVDGDTLVVGFRGPVLRHGFVPVMRVSGFPKVAAEEVVLVQLGGRGIRDLVKVDEGFLVLAGPVGDSDQSHQIYLWDGKNCLPGKDVPKCSVLLKGEVAHTGSGRAEGMTVLNATAKAYEVLVVFDGVDGGAPTVYQVAR